MSHAAGTAGKPCVGHDRTAYLTNLVKSEMDPLVNSLQEDETQFVEQYFAARRIQKTGIRHEGPELPKKDLMENLAISVSSLQTETKEAKAPVNDGVMA